MKQLYEYLGAVMNQEQYEYKLLTSACLVGSRGDQETITKALKGN